MPKMPDKYDVGAAPSARSGRVVAAYNAGVVGSGAKALGAGMQQFGDTVTKIGLKAKSSTADDVSDVTKFEIYKRYVEFEDLTKAAAKDAQDAVDGDPLGFSRRVQTSYMESAKQFFNTIPDALKPEYEKKMFVHETQLVRGAMDFEDAGRQAHYSGLIQTEFDKSQKFIDENPDAIGDTLKSFKEYIDNVPTSVISAKKKKEIWDEWKPKLQERALGAMPVEERAKAMGMGLEFKSQDPASMVGDVKNRAMGMAAELNKRGFSPYAVAAIVGDAIYDTAIRPSGAEGAGGTAGGVFNWSGDRLKALKEFADEDGSNWKEFTTQIDFMVHEMQGGDPRAVEAYKMLQNAKSVDEAMTAFMHYVRPMGYSAEDPTTSHAFSIRRNNAESVMRIMDPKYGAPDGIFKDLPADVADRLRRSSVGDYDAYVKDLSVVPAAAKRAMEQTVKDDVQSILDTGNGVSSITPAQVEHVLGPDKAAEWVRDRTINALKYDAVKNLGQMSEQQLQDYLANLEPESGIGYEANDDIRNYVGSKIDELRSMRGNDGAASVEDHPYVKAIMAMDGQDTPEWHQALVEARIQAQLQIGVPEGLINPITRDEAKAYADPFKGAGVEDLKVISNEVLPQIYKRYGEYADEVVDMILRQNIKDDDKAAEISAYLKKAMKGERIATPDEIIQHEAAQTEWTGQILDRLTGVEDWDTTDNFTPLAVNFPNQNNPEYYIITEPTKSERGTYTSFVILPAKEGGVIRPIQDVVTSYQMGELEPISKQGSYNQAALYARNSMPKAFDENDWRNKYPRHVVGQWATPQAVQYLRDNPDTIKAFIIKYGWQWVPNDMMPNSGILPEAKVKGRGASIGVDKHKPNPMGLGPMDGP